MPELPAVLTKARRLYDEGAVAEVPDARAFQVKGDSATYTVVVSKGRTGAATCTCPAGVHGRECSHKYAVATALRVQNEDSGDPFDRLGS